MSDFQSTLDAFLPAGQGLANFSKTKSKKEKCLDTYIHTCLHTGVSFKVSFGSVLRLQGGAAGGWKVRGRRKTASCLEIVLYDANPCFCFLVSTIKKRTAKITGKGTENRKAKKKETNQNKRKENRKGKKKKTRKNQKERFFLPNARGRNRIWPKQL